MGRFILALLGNPQLYHEDRPVDLPTRKALALLVYLAVEGGTHSREKLAAIFWPESDSGSGRAIGEQLAMMLPGEQQVMAQIFLGALYRALGDPGAALAVEEAAWLALQQREGVLPFPLDDIVALGLTCDHTLRGDGPAAATFARQVPLPAPGIWLFLVGHFPWWLVVEALWRAGDPERARQLAQRLGELAQSYPRLRLPHRRALATLAILAERPDEAQEHLQAAVALADFRRQKIGFVFQLFNRCCLQSLDVRLARTAAPAAAYIADGDGHGSFGRAAGLAPGYNLRTTRHVKWNATG